MKVILRGNDVVSLNLIEKVSVSETSGRVEVLVKHKTEKSEKEKTSTLIDTRRRLTKEKAEIIANELLLIVSAYSDAEKEDAEARGSEQGNPLAGIEYVLEGLIDSNAWTHGHLSVPFNEIKGITDDALSLALAELCWRWPHSHMISDAQIVLRMNVDESDIEKIAANEAYSTRVKELMISERTAEEFTTWAKPYMGQLGRFGSRMRLTEDESRAIFQSVAEHHSVDLSKKKAASRSTDNSEPTDYDIVWGEYHEPDSTKFKVFGRTTVSAPTLNRAKTLATQELNEWLQSEIDEKDEKKREQLIEAQESMSNSVSLHKGKWEEGKGRAKRFFGNHMNVWCGMFLGVSVSKNASKGE